MSRRPLVAYKGCSVRHSRYLPIFVLLSAAAIPSPSKASDPVIDNFAFSPEQLFAATVMSVSKKSEKLMDAPAAIYVLTNEDILRSGATSIPEALRMVPGVQVARSHAGGWAISVRGFNGGLANKLLVLMDGREVYDQLFSGVYWDMQDTVLEDIDRIEVIRGPGASLWGANAVNGVINIITKNTKDTQGTLVSALAGNQDRAIGAVRHGGKFGENGYYRAYTKALYRDEYHTISGAGAQDPQRSYRGGFRADWDHNEGKDVFTLQGDMASGDNHQFRVSPLLQLNTERVHATGWNLLGRWTRELPEDSLLTLQAYVDYAYRDQLLITDQRTTMDIDGQYEFSPIGRHKTIVGGRYRLSVDAIKESAFIATSDTSRRDQIFSGFVQDKVTLVPQAWFLTLGSKFEHNDYSGLEVQPNARLQWHIDDGQMAWASVARAVRTPSQLEHDLTIQFISTFFGLLPNPHFDSEELVAYEAGYRWQLAPSLLFDVAAFYNDYDKLAANVVSAAPFPITLAISNGTKAETYGGEAVMNWRANDTLNLSAAYSFLKMQLHGPANGLDAETAEGQSPRHQFNLRSQWNIRDDLSFDTALYHVGALPNYKIDRYWRLDMVLGWKIDEGLQFNLVGQNLFSGSRHEFQSLTEGLTPPAKIEPAVYGKFTWMF